MTICCTWCRPAVGTAMLALFPSPPSLSQTCVTPPTSEISARPTGSGGDDAVRLAGCEGSVSESGVEDRRGLVVASLSPRRPLGVRTLAS